MLTLNRRLAVVALSALVAGGLTACSGAAPSATVAAVPLVYGKDGGCGLGGPIAISLDGTVLQDGVRLPKGSAAVLAAGRQAKVTAAPVGGGATISDLAVQFGNGSVRRIQTAGQRPGGDNGRGREVSLTVSRSGQSGSTTEELQIVATVTSDVPGCEGDAAQRVVNQPVSVSE